MKFAHIRSVAAVFLLSLLTACGGADYDTGTPTALSAAQVRVGIAAPLAASPQALTPGGLDPAQAGLDAGPVGLEAASLRDEIAESGGKNPVPDCEPENCQGLRIIDGNAEAYRFDAVRRSAAEAGSTS
jgi:hypothetical protein